MIKYLLFILIIWLLSKIVIIISQIQVSRRQTVKNVNKKKRMNLIDADYEELE